MKTRPKAKIHRHAHSERPQAISTLTDRLRGQSRKITGARKAILEILRRHPHPMTNRQILAAMRGKQCDLATIYRAMHLLTGLGMVKQFDFGDGAARFELVAERGNEHHHHLVCRHCADVVEIEECFVAGVERRIATENRFKAVTHNLEFFGICPKCQ